MTTTTLKIVPPYTVRQMRDEDVPEVLRIWAAVDLHEGTGTIQTFRAADPAGFVVAEHSDTGEILGMCSGCFAAPDCAYVGLYGVKNEYQGCGIGVSLWTAIMDHIGDRNAGLYAVPGKLELYRDRAAFRVMDGDRKMQIYESDNIPQEVVNDLLNTPLPDSAIQFERISSASGPLVRKLVEYDQGIHGYEREVILKGAIQEPESIAMAAIRDGALLGYGLLRTNNVNKAMAGPLYSDSEAVARRLMGELLKNFPVALNNGLLYMTLNSNPAAMKFASEVLKLHHHSDEQCERLFRKSAHQAAWDKVWAIHTPNFSIL